LRSDKTVGALLYLGSDGQCILLVDTVMAVFVVYYYNVWRSDRRWVFFSTQGQMHNTF
jgi:hypothetical protein